MISEASILSQCASFEVVPLLSAPEIDGLFSFMGIDGPLSLFSMSESLTLLLSM